ncbi:MAG: rhomboid family intramembrane serine protease [Eubacterium sp.]|nr:rhomboid family intramembrane serine protease [Eubacterium sp.]
MDRHVSGNRSSDDALETIFHREKKSWITFLLIAVNIIAFAVESYKGFSEASLLGMGASRVSMILSGQYWRLLTALFLHISLAHLGSNLLGLLFLGDQVEAALGHVRFLILYLAGGIAGNYLSVLFYYRQGEDPLALGASTSVFALLGSMLVLAITGTKGKKSRSDARHIIMYLVLALLSGLVSPGIDGPAHLGGLVAGSLLTLLLIAVRQ